MKNESAPATPATEPAAPAAEPAAPVETPAAEPAATEATADTKGPKGVPDGEKAAEKYKGQRDQWKQLAEDYKAKLDQAADPEAVKKVKDDYDKAVADLKQQNAATELSYNVEIALIKAGCVDTAAAKAHIDLNKLALKDGAVEGLDTKALVTSYPYLFAQVPKVDTAAPSTGTGDGEEATSIKEGIRLSLKPKK